MSASPNNEPRKSAATVVPCSPFDLLEVQDWYTGRVLVFSFPSSDLRSEAVSHIQAAIEIVAQENPAITGHVRHDWDGRPEIIYTAGNTFGDRLRVRHVNDSWESCHKYDQLVSLGAPPKAWSPNIFTMYGEHVANKIHAGEPVPTMGIQVTWIEGGMVICAQFHHSWTDLRGYVANVELPLKQALDKVSKKMSPPTVLQEMIRWVEDASGSVASSLSLARKSGVIAAIKKACTSDKIPKHLISDPARARLSVLNHAKQRAAWLPAGFFVPYMVNFPDLNQTPLPVSPVNFSGAPTRPYRSVGYASAIFVFPAKQLRDIKARILNLLSYDAARYLTVQQRKYNWNMKITSNTALMALLWTHISDIRSSRPRDEYSGRSLYMNDVSQFATVVDVCSRYALNPNYPGNCTFPARARLEVKKLVAESDDAYERSGSLISTAVLTRAAVTLVASVDVLTRDYLEEAAAWVTTLKVPRQRQLNMSYNVDHHNSTDLMMTSWSKLSATDWRIHGVVKGPAYQRKLFRGSTDGAIVVLPKVSDQAP